MLTMCNKHNDISQRTCFFTKTTLFEVINIGTVIICLVKFDSLRNVVCVRFEMERVQTKAT
jgi:hypothetical protein